MRIAIACGGTGGHVFPGVAVARVLRDRGHQLTLWLAGKAIERTSLTEGEFPVITLPAQRHSAPARLFALLSALRAALTELRTRPVDVMLAMGGYGAVGPVLAARRLRIPVVLHEPNVIPGRATAWLARCAAAVSTGFPETAGHLRRARCVYTGVPVRPELEAAAAAPRDPPEIFTVLVMGGSQGAHALNLLCAEAICRLHSSGMRLRVIHLSGALDADSVAAAYRTAGVPATVHGFLKNMAGAYAGASVAVARAGAGACAELALFGLPALLVPYPYAARQHQRANALAVAAAGAAEMVEQRELTVERLCDFLTWCATQPDRLAAMRQAARGRARCGAAQRLAELVEQTAGHVSGTRLPQQG